MITNCKYLFFLILIFSSLISTSLVGQNSDQLYFENFTVDDGLPGRYIFDINQDKYGYLWLSTPEGVAKFDGYEFETFRNIPGDTTSISENDVWRIITDIYGNVWLDTYLGIDLYVPASNSFQRYFQDPAKADYIVPGVKTDVISTSKGILLIATRENGLISYNPVTKDFKRYTHDPDDPASISSNRIRSLSEDNNGTIWFGSFSTGLNKFDPETEIFTNITFEEDDPNRIPDNNVQELFIDDNQVLWIDYAGFRSEAIEEKKGNETGIWQMDLKTGEYGKALYDPVTQPVFGPLRDIIQSDSETYWIIKSGPESRNPGLYKYSVSEQSFSRYNYAPNKQNSLLSNEVLDIFVDRDGNLWVGTSMGLSKADITRNQFDSFTPLPDDPISQENFLVEIIHKENDTYWIMRGGTQPPIEWNKKTGDWKNLSPETPEINFISTLNRYFWTELNDMIWKVNYPDTLSSYDRSTGEIENYTVTFPDSTDASLNSITSDGDNILWLATNKGIGKFSVDNQSFTHYPLESPYSPGDSLSVLFILHNEKGDIWTLTIDVALDSTKEKQGVYLSKFDPLRETFTRPAFNENYYESLAHGYAIDFMEDSKGDLWISKSNGLVHYDTSEEYFTWYTQESGLSTLFVDVTVEDKFGNIWIGGTYGISRFDPASNTFRNFERSDGYVPLNNPSMRILNGDLFVLGQGGMNIIDPAAIDEVRNFPEVLITGIKLNGKNLTTDIPFEELKNIEIPWGETSLEIEYTAINFSAPEKTTYALSMESSDVEFRESNNRRYAQFTNLEPGDYTFTVSATNAEGLKSLQDASLAISILPPWWRTIPAYASYLLLIGGLIFGVDRFQRKRLLQKERDKARKKELEQAKEIEKAYENLKAAQQQLVQQEKLASLGQLTAGIAHEIKNPLNFVNNFSDVSIELVEEAREELKEKLTADSHQLTAILDDIEFNLRKIHEHGSRADGIVKSMLQHSRGGDGKREPTPLNPLVKEYVNLAFHGMRAGDDPINVDIELDLDESIGDVNLVAEDFSRVILNLVNNSFDAMREKLTGDGRPKTEVSPFEGGKRPRKLSGEQGDDTGPDYNPKLLIRTRKSDNSITIEIEDNGPGIPEKMKDKILQPFFTTKKGTAGTGLGLSITNDIVKAHGGSLNIRSTDGEGSTFIIELNNK